MAEHNPIDPQAESPVKKSFFGRMLFPFFFLLGGGLVFLTTELSRWLTPHARGDESFETRPAPSPVTALDAAVPPGEARRSGLKTWVVGLVPIALLLGVGVFFFTGSGAGMLAAPDGESTTMLFDKTILQPGQIALHVRNSSTQPLTLTTVNINDSIIPFVLKPAKTIPPLGSAVVYLLYPWVQGQSYEITLYSADTASFVTTITDAAATPATTNNQMQNLTVIGLGIGLLPLLIGLAWFPTVNKAGTRPFLFLIALAGGLLVYLGIAVADEALENTALLSGAFQGAGLLAVAFTVTFLFLNAFSGLHAAIRDGHQHSPTAPAWILAFGIGFQNLAEGLAVGAAFSFGAVSLAVLFMIGLVLQNAVQGMHLTSILEKNDRSIWRLLGMGVLGGLPGLLGIWLGGMITSQMLLVLSIAIGGGAVAAALYDLIRNIRQTTAHRPMPVTVIAGFVAGILALYVASMLIV
jgi:zinc transporter, ZIP family